VPAIQPPDFEGRAAGRAEGIVRRGGPGSVVRCPVTLAKFILVLCSRRPSRVGSGVLVLGPRGVDTPPCTVAAELIQFAGPARMWGACARPSFRMD